MAHRCVRCAAKSRTLLGNSGQTGAHQPRLMSTRPSTIAGLAILTCGAATASADVVYSYVGNDFTSFTSPFTEFDKVTISLTFSESLGDNLAYSAVTPISVTISDGVDTITMANPSGAGYQFSLATNASGVPDLWFVLVPFGTHSEIYSKDLSAVNQEDLGITEVPGPLYPDATNGLDPGSWSGATTVTPLPATLPLFATGLGALGLLGWRRKKKAAALVA